MVRKAPIQLSSYSSSAFRDKATVKAVTPQPLRASNEGGGGPWEGVGIVGIRPRFVLAIPPAPNGPHIHRTESSPRDQKVQPWTRVVTAARTTPVRLART